MSESLCILNVNKYCQSFLPKRIWLTDSVWEAYFLTLVFLSLPVWWRKIFFFLNCVSLIPGGAELIFIWGVIYMSSGNCLLPLLPLIFIRDTLYILWVIILYLKCVPSIFFPVTSLLTLCLDIFLCVCCHYLCLVCFWILPCSGRHSYPKFPKLSLIYPSNISTFLFLFSSVTL